MDKIIHFCCIGFNWDSRIVDQFTQGALDRDVCKSPTKLTEAELESELYKRGIQPSGDKEQMIRQLTTPEGRKLAIMIDKFRLYSVENSLYGWINLN